MLNKDYKDILSELLAQQAEFILVGAYAMAAHGFPRATMDIDLWVNPTAENAQNVYRALENFGAPLNQISADDFATPGIIFQIGVAPRRIDILTSISGVEYQEANAASQTTDIDGCPIKVLSSGHLIKNKKAAGRPKDLIDVETLRNL